MFYETLFTRTLQGFKPIAVFMSKDESIMSNLTNASNEEGKAVKLQLQLAKDDGGTLTLTISNVGVDVPKEAFLAVGQGLSTLCNTTFKAVNRIEMEHIV